MELKSDKGEIKPPELENLNRTVMELKSTRTFLSSKSFWRPQSHRNGIEMLIRQTPIKALQVPQSHRNGIEIVLEKICLQFGALPQSHRNGIEIVPMEKLGLSIPTSIAP